MASFEHEGSTLVYEVQGAGPAVLALAPGGMRSATALWNNAPFNPLSVLSDCFTVISMDQRNAGASRGPVREDDGWGSFLEDQLALLDHLGIERCAALGMCIGGPYVMNLLRAQPERFYAGVLLQPIGLDNNLDAFLGMVDSWAEALLPERPDLSPETLAGCGTACSPRTFYSPLPRRTCAAARCPSKSCSVMISFTRKAPAAASPSWRPGQSWLRPGRGKGSGRRR